MTVKSPSGRSTHLKLQCIIPQTKEILRWNVLFSVLPIGEGALVCLKLQSVWEDVRKNESNKGHSAHHQLNRRIQLRSPKFYTQKGKRLKSQR